MEETAVIVVWFLVVSALIAVLARWFVRGENDDYVDYKDYTLRDFYTRKK